MLRLTDIRKSFGPLRAVDGLSLEVKPGEILGLLGPNGAGKSTTISMAVGLLKPDSGTVDVDGAGSPQNPGVRARIGLCPQAIALYDDLTAAENLEFFCRLYEIPGTERPKKVSALLEKVGLSDRASSRVKTFSGGMKRRLNLAAALVNAPPLVLLDEPTAGVDPQSRNAIFELVLSMKRDGAAVVYTTHYMEEAQRLCDRIAVMDHGKLLALGTVDALIAQYGGESVVVVQDAAGERSVKTAEPMVELQRALGSGQTLGVRVDRPNLESVFLNLTGRSLRD